ncbi:MAG: hypothetical protein KDA85_12105 [Planctomycetaceae bacterium]|nr:hypothetical protein [Planctomycetaceae bacterium]
MNYRHLILTFLISTTLISAPAEAGLLRTLWKSAREVAGKVIGEGTEAASRKGLRTAVRHSDDAARVIVRHSDDAARLAARFGDDAAVLTGR